MIKYLLFDMDGVLVDAREWHYDALNRALELFGYKISRFDHLETYDGLPTRTKLHMLSKERSFPKGLHPFVSTLKQKYTVEIIHRECRPTFQHLYALSRLKADGYGIAVCSNSIRRTMELMLGYTGIGEFVDFFISNEDVSKPKPDPEIYLTAMEKFGAHPRECLIVEDNPNGIKAAMASGGNLHRVQGVDEVSYTNLKDAIRATTIGLGDDPDCYPARGPVDVLRVERFSLSETAH
jgi:beta-phosphoglucomutase